jgi:hypothetical protein
MTLHPVSIEMLTNPTLRSDRSPKSGPLEKRPGLLGHLLRFLRSTSHPHCQQTLDCFFWALSGSDGETLRFLGPTFRKAAQQSAFAL